MSNENKKRSVLLKDMGCFMYGGRVAVQADGETGHYDHGYAEYFVPQNASNYPIVFWHGNGQCGRCWESTADGRDGFREIFLRRDVPVYIIDQPRHGRAALAENRFERTIVYPSVEKERLNWEIFRHGDWTLGGPATLYPGSQVPSSPYAIDQFLRMECMTNGDEPATLEYVVEMGKNGKELLDQTGECILFTHSNSGKYGWYTGVLASDRIKAIYSYEPGMLLFPDDYQYTKVETPVGEVLERTMIPYVIPADLWMNLTKFPIRIYWGDYIVKEPCDVYGYDCWRMSVEYFKQFVDLINARGGDAKMFMLPDLGLHGNTHYAFGELNNVEFADLLEADMRSLGLLNNDKPYQGPTRKMLEDYNIPFKKL